MTSYTETFDLGQQFAVADLALPASLEDRLIAALDTDSRLEITAQINEAVTAKIREHGVTHEGEWLGVWSAADIVRDVLTRLAVTADVTPGDVYIDALDKPIRGPVDGYDEDTEDADDNRPAIVAALAALGWEPIPDEEWLGIEGGADTPAGAIRIPVRPIAHRI